MNTVFLVIIIDDMFLRTDLGMAYSIVQITNGKWAQRSPIKIFVWPTNDKCKNVYLVKSFI